MTHQHDNNETQCSHCNGVTDEELVARYAKMIAEYGWAAVGVFGEDGPPFVYTVGLQATYNHPELLIYGLDIKLGHNLLADAIEKIKAGTPLQPGTTVGEVIAGYDVAVVKVDEPLDPRFPLNMCTFFTDPEYIEALQLVWPEANGKFPWEPEGDDRQVVLGDWWATA